eukprot:CAMPEP_0177660066 /NCGR_PEP_ID=MMETSP0447-20121125/17803_1 /TAXON_ID=0 /ORGANISM="Stygamoeba regulata, Strain BSH-02190019" /LENGTH=579 /DNA_ID=CAMNT_0019165029 /DNA_START=153 /DNA_END=1892 /DNA_ORIENTATION=+
MPSAAYLPVPSLCSSSSRGATLSPPAATFDILSRRSQQYCSSTGPDGSEPRTHEADHCAESESDTPQRSNHNHNHKKKTKKNRSRNSLLRQFYLMVHPDLFHAFPEEQRANENALQQLNSFIDYHKQRIATRQGTQRHSPLSGLPPPPPQRVTFFIPTDVAEQNTNKTHAHEKSTPSTGKTAIGRVLVDPASDLCKLMLDLHFIGPDTTVSSQQLLSQTLDRLFVAVGLLEDGTLPEGASAEEDERISFTEFVNGSWERAVRLREQSKKAERDLNLAKITMLRRFGTPVVFDQEELYSHTRQKEVIDPHLIRAFEQDSEQRPNSSSLQGSIVNLTASPSAEHTLIDFMGRILLPVNSVDQWSPRLAQIDPETVHQYRQEFLLCERLEDQLRSQLSVGKVQAQSHSIYQNHESFLQYCQRLQDALEAIHTGVLSFPQALQPRLSTLTLTFVGDVGDDETAQVHFTTQLGLMIPLHLNFVQLNHYFEKNHLSLCSLLAKHDRALKHENNMIVFVRRQLLLAAITKDADVSPLQMASCCVQLRGSARTVGQVMRGLHIHVHRSGKIHLSENGVLHIPWQFEL